MVEPLASVRQSHLAILMGGWRRHLTTSGVPSLHDSTRTWIAVAEQGFWPPRASFVELGTQCANRLKDECPPADSSPNVADAGSCWRCEITVRGGLSAAVLTGQSRLPNGSE
jgi:hypothetical protein